MRAGAGALREAMCPLRALTVPMELMTSAKGCITATAVLTWTSALVLSLDSSAVHPPAATEIPTIANRFIVRSYPGYRAERCGGDPRLGKIVDVLRQNLARVSLRFEY